ncbi:MAG TPA: FliM/FliN family flagellar motor switch protein [Sphingomonadaceae bacterium]|nr:FliM/FliN family flagellar motor switch protein [Sphingomonadaceae bacterium]
MVDDDAKTLPPARKAALPPRLIDHVEVNLEVILGEARLSVAELAALAMGDLVPVDRMLTEAAEVRVNGRVIARGEIVSVDDKYAIRVTEIGG